MEPEAPSAELNALNHAWDWFKYHAEQRMTMIRFSMAVIGATGAAVGYLIKQRQDFFSVLVSLFGAIVSYCLLRIDRRTADLVKIGEEALRVEERRLGLHAANDHLDFCTAANHAMQRYCRKFPYSYSQNFQVIFWVVIGALLIVALHIVI